MFKNKILYCWTLSSILLVVLLLALVGCGGGSKEPEPVTVQRVTVTPQNTLTRTPVPTWTPSNTPPPANTPTPGPTFTPRAPATATPQPITGAQRMGQDQTVVTVLEADLNTSIGNIHQSRGLASLPTAPTIAMRQEGWLEIHFTFYNEFMGADSRVDTLARLSASGGQLAMTEIRGDRHVQGVTIDEESVNMVLDLILQGINEIVINLVPAPIGSYEIDTVSSFPGFLRVIVNQ